jgi:drug/metabolite transporter (DMT)-like permease
MPSHPAGDIRRGIFLMLVGMSLFCFNDALGKWLVAAHPVAMLLAVRSLAGGVVLAPLVRHDGFLRTFRVTRWKLHFVRTLLITGDIGLFYWAARYMPLAGIMTIYMSAPLLVAVLSPALLGERVDWRTLAAALGGFSGVILVLSPSDDFWLMPSLIALAGMTVYTLGMICTRRLRGDGNLTLLSYQTLVTGLIGTGLLAVDGTTMPSWGDLGLLALLGWAGLGGHALMNRSLSLAPAAVVVPFQYVSILWAMTLDFAVWHTLPNWQGSLGAALIVASGLFIFFREQRPDLASSERAD